MSDCEDFAVDVLERAKARSKVLKGNVGKSESLKVTFGAVENVPIPADDYDESVLEDEALEVEARDERPGKIVDDDSEDAEEDDHYKNMPVQSAVANLPLSDLNVKMSASPVRRMRLRELASTINGWEDDCTHTTAPTSRFNLTKTNSPQQRKPQPLMTSSPKLAPSVETAVLNALLKKPLETDSIINCSNNSSRCDASELAEGAVGDSSVENSEILTDSIVYINTSDAQNNENRTPPVSVTDPNRSSSQACVLNESFIEALEAQGFVQSPTSSKLTFQYRAEKEVVVSYQLPGPKKAQSPVKRAGSPVRQTPICSKSPSPIKNSPAVVVENAPKVKDLIRKQFESFDEKQKPTCTAEKVEADRSIVSVAEKAAMFESICNASNSIKEVDPTELSVSERRKLFEGKKNLFQSSAPKERSPAKSESEKVFRRPPRPSMIPAQPLKMKLQMFEQGVKEEAEEGSSFETEEAPPTKPGRFQAKPTVAGQPPPPPPIPNDNFVKPASPLSPRRSPAKQGEGILRLSKYKDESMTSEEDDSYIPSPVSKASTRQVSFADLQKRRSSTSPSGKRSASPKASYPGIRDVKRIKVHDPKPGRMYPSLTDIETTENETDTDMDTNTMTDTRGYHDDDELESETSTMSGTSSLGTYIERKAVQNSPLRHTERKSYDEINASLACRKVDEFIDEALEGQDYTMDTNIEDTSPVASSSPRKMNFQPSTTNLSGNLVHTVSFYRRQQQTGNVSSPHPAMLTPKRIASIEEEEPSVEERTFSYEDEVNQQIAKLQAEAQAQQGLMAQASKALSLCKATMEFSDSRENVECEKVLLIATHKHSALVNEIHRLKTEGILGRKVDVSPLKGDLGPSCKGNMTLDDVAIQLKREFLPMALKGETVYHFIALVKYRNQLEASSLVSMGNGIESSNVKGGVLYFPSSFSIKNLEPDFKVTVEVYVLHTLREFLPHEAKYHIKKEKSKLTPKKIKQHDGSKFVHFLHSPAGPDAVQASKFQNIGSVSIDITTLQRNHWQLERVSNTGPLEGSASLKIQCSAEGGVEYRGFLTMFHDISGYGDWHRRWCKLTPSELTFWMYPEDETKDMEPVGRISLRSCVTSRVGPVPRDVCARANTFLFVTTRSPQKGDKDTLVLSCHETHTAIRHLISADTREERDLWCRQFNRALANLRAWDPQAHSPDDSLF